MGATLQDGFQREVLSGLQRIAARLDTVDKRLDSVEAQLQTLETERRRVRDEVVEVKISLARLDGRVGQLPDAIQLLGFVLAVPASSGVVRVFAP